MLLGLTYMDWWNYIRPRAGSWPDGVWKCLPKDLGVCVVDPLNKGLADLLGEVTEFQRPN